MINMYVYRGEKLKDPKYIEVAKEEHKTALKFDMVYHSEELEKAKKEREQILIDKKEDIEKYDMLTNKPISQLTEQEKIEIVSIANGYYSITGIKQVNLNEPLTEDEIEQARAVLNAFLKSPLDSVDWSIEYSSKRIDELKNNESNIFCIGLDCNSITKENIDTIKKHILDLKKVGAEIHVAIDGDMHNKSNDSETDYLYSKEEIEMLSDLDGFLLENGIKPLKICEVKRVNDLDDFDKGWTLNQVVSANNKIDSIVATIKKNNLSPFEAMLYIHKFASTFKYKDDINIESPRVLPSILNSDKIVCSGYATLVKAIVDRLNIPELKCDLVGCSIVKRKSIGGHTHNLVTIKDPKYGIDGVYVEDACFDSKKDDYEKGRGFGHCLYPVNDVMNFNNGVGYYNPDFPDRFSNLLINSRGFIESMAQLGNKNKIKKLIYNIKEYFKYKQTPKLVKTYGDKSTPIPLQTYKEGLIALYSTVYDDPKKVEELVDKQIENSKINSMKTFNSSADNTFSSSVSREDRKKMKKNITGPSATQ